MANSVAYPFTMGGGAGSDGPEPLATGTATGGAEAREPTALVDVPPPLRRRQWAAEEMSSLKLLAKSRG